MDININLHITADSAIGQLLSALATAAAAAAAAQAQPGNDPAPAAATSTRGRKASAGAASDTTAKTTSSATDEATVEGPAGETLDYEKDIKPLILKVVKELGEDEGVALLGAFKVKGGRELKPADYPAFKRMTEKLLADKVGAGGLA